LPNFSFQRLPGGLPTKPFCLIGKVRRPDASHFYSLL